MSIPFTTVGQGGPALFFLHANGYPSECYRPLLEMLALDFRLICMLQRPLWKGSNPMDLNTWHPLSDDFIQFLDERNAGQVTAVGHSLGGVVALRAAIRQPERFKALVLIDPVLLPPMLIFAWQILRILGLSDRAHPSIQAARHRRTRFKDLDRVFRSYRQKPVFKFMTDQSLKACIKGMTCRDGDSYELCYPADWELQIYRASIWKDMDIWRCLPGLNVPLLLIRGAETNTFRSAAVRKILSAIPTAQYSNIPNSSHLVPLERPDQVSQAVKDFLQEFR